MSFIFFKGLLIWTMHSYPIPNHTYASPTTHQKRSSPHEEDKTIAQIFKPYNKSQSWIFEQELFPPSLEEESIFFCLLSETWEHHRSLLLETLHLKTLWQKTNNLTHWIHYCATTHSSCSSWHYKSKHFFYHFIPAGMWLIQFQWKYFWNVRLTVG